MGSSLSRTFVSKRIEIQGWALFNDSLKLYTKRPRNVRLVLRQVFTFKTELIQSGVGSVFILRGSSPMMVQIQQHKKTAPLSERIEERVLLYIIKNRFAFKITAVVHNKLICTFQKHFVTVIVNSRQFVFICFELKCNCFLRL